MLTFERMSNPNIKTQVIENVLFNNISSDGKAVGRVNNMVVFAGNAVPGDLCTVKIIKKKKNLLEATIVSVDKPSEYRQNPECKHFGLCGGCKWQNLDYQQQIKFKSAYAREQLLRIGNLHAQLEVGTIGADKLFEYRNKLEFSFGNRRWVNNIEETHSEGFIDNALGFHISGRFDKILHINVCHLMPEPVNQIKDFVYQYALKNKLSFYDAKHQHGFLRNLVFRQNSKGNLMVIFICSPGFDEKLEDLMKAVSSNFKDVFSWQIIINPKKNDSWSDLNATTWMGERFLTEQLGNKTFIISPVSFFQTNIYQSVKLYDVVKAFAELQGNELLYDLYCGTGSIGIYLSEQVNRIVGVEYVEKAVEDARINANLNNVSNATFYSGDLALLLNNHFLEQNGKPDVIVTDPPRSGMHEKVVSKLLEIKSSKIVYVSCNVSTMARDLNMLQQNYTIEKVTTVDMFPHTSHIECVALLKLKN